VDPAATLISDLMSIGGGSVGGSLITLVVLRLVGINLNKNSAKPACPLTPDLRTLEGKFDQMIQEQIRTNTHLEVLVQRRVAGP